MQIVRTKPTRRPLVAQLQYAILSATMSLIVIMVEARLRVRFKHTPAQHAIPSPRVESGPPAGR